MFINNPKVLATESSLAFGLPWAEGILQSVSTHHSHFAGALGSPLQCLCRNTNTTENTDCAGSHRTKNSLSTACVILDFFHSLFPISPLPFSLLLFVPLLFWVSLISIRATNTRSHPKGSPGSSESPGKTTDCASPAASCSVGSFPYCATAAYTW